MNGRFCNVIMDTLILLHQRTKQTSLNQIVPIVWDGTVQASPLRHFLVDMYAFTLETDPGMAEVLCEIPHMFLVYVITAITVVREQHKETWWEYLEGEGYYWKEAFELRMDSGDAQ